MKQHFAFSLFALVDRHKIDPDTSDLFGLAQQLGHYLAHNFTIAHADVSIEGVKNAAGAIDLYLLLTDVPQQSWPALIALTETQKTTLFQCQFAADGTNQFSLVPLK